MTTTLKLLTATTNKTIGNHTVKHTATGRKFIYFATAIVVTDDTAHTFHTDNGGYSTVSTTRAINDYRRRLVAMGYTEV